MVYYIVLFLLYFLVSLHGDKCKRRVQRGASPRHYYTADLRLFSWGNPLICLEEVLFLQPLLPPKRFDIPPPPPWLGDAQKVQARSYLPFNAM